MPTYDYQCRSCGTVTEVIHSMLEDGPTTCEVCGGDLRRVLFPTGIIFKGSGFYRNDSRAAQAGSAGSASSDAATGGSTGAESGAKPGSKPAPSTPERGSSAPESGAKTSSPGSDS